MASFGGHTLPGTLFIIFAIWINIRENLTFFKKLDRSRFLKRDGLIICVLVGTGVFVELFWPWNGNHPPYGLLHEPGSDHFFKPMNWQHFTMYIFFGFYGVARLLESFDKTFSGADRLAGGLAFFVEGYLFANHVHGRSVLDSKIHMLIVLACYTSSAIWVVIFFVCDVRRLFLLDVVNSAVMFAQGTWFWHVAIILYGSHPWSHANSSADHDEMGEHHDHSEHEEVADGVHNDHMVMDEEHVNSMFAVLFFCWHVAFALIFMMMLTMLCYFILKKKGKIDPSFLNGVTTNNNKANGYAKLTNKEYQEASFEEHSAPLLTAEEDENVLFEKV